MESAHTALLLVAALAAGVISQAVARHARLPAIVLLLAVGAGLGPDGLGWLDPADLGPGLFSIVELAVAVILFEGGLNLDLARLRRASAPIRRLVTWGAVVTWAGGAVAARYVLDERWDWSLLFGALVVVTGPTVIGPLVSELRLRPRLATVLEAEGVLIDPIGALLAALLLTVVLGPPADTLPVAVVDLGERIGLGIALGAGVGGLLALAMRTRRLIPEGQSNIVALAAVLLLFEVCEVLAPTSGVLAVTVAGIVVGNVGAAEVAELREFKDQLSVMLIGLLFVLLAADVRIADVQRLGWPGAAVVASLILVIRPIGVAWATAGSDLSWRERVFLGAVAPRGIVAAAVASLTASELERAGMPGGADLRATVFLTIAATVLLAGVAGRPAAAALGVRMPGRDRIAILGAQGLGFLLAEELRTGSENVVFLDTNPQNATQAQEKGFSVVFGNALEERTLRRARFELVGTAIGLTPNQELNGIFVARASELFSVPRRYVALNRLDKGLTQGVVEGRENEVLFETSHDVERWDVRHRHQEIVVERFVYEGGPDSAPPFESVSPKEERFLVLSVRRGKRRSPMSMRTALRAGDVISVAIHTPDREAVRVELTGRGFVPEPAPDEQEAAC